MNIVHQPVELMKAWSVWIAVLCCVFIPNASAEATYAERLGWKSDDTVLVIELAEGGMSHSVNRGITEVLDKGQAASISTMMTGPWLPNLMRYARTKTSLDIGVELTLNSEYEAYRWGPVSGKPKVPSLVDEHGYLWKSTALFAAKATPDDVEVEIRAQIERAEAMGISISHLTSHLSALFAKEEFFERYLKVAIEKQIPVLLPAGLATYANIQNTNLVQMVKKHATRIWNSGLPLVDDMHTASAQWESGAKKLTFTSMLHILRPGLTVMVINPAIPTDEFNLIAPNGRSRLADAMAMQDIDLKRVIESRGIIMTNWKEIKERRAKAAKL